MAKNNAAQAKRRADKARKRTMSSRSRKRSIRFNQEATIWENIAFSAGLILSGIINSGGIGK